MHFFSCAQSNMLINAKSTHEKEIFLRLHENLFIYLFFTRECQTQKYAPHEHIHAREQQSFTVVVVAVLPGYFSLIQCNISRCLFVFAEAVWCKVWLGFFVIFFSPSLVDFLSTSLSLIFLIFDHKISKTIHGIGKTKILIYYCLSTQMHKHTHTHVRTRSITSRIFPPCLYSQTAREKKTPSVQIDHVKAQTIPNRTNNNKQHQKPNTVCVWSLLFWRNGNERSEKQSDSRDMKFKSSKREKETHTEHRAQAQHNKNEIHTCIASDHNNKLDYKKTLTNIHTATIEETQLACM